VHDSKDQHNVDEAHYGASSRKELSRTQTSADVAKKEAGDTAQGKSLVGHIHRLTLQLAKKTDGAA